MKPFTRAWYCSSAKQLTGSCSSESPPTPPPTLCRSSRCCCMRCAAAAASAAASAGQEVRRETSPRRAGGPAAAEGCSPPLLLPPLLGSRCRSSDSRSLYCRTAQMPDTSVRMRRVQGVLSRARRQSLEQQQPGQRSRLKSDGCEHRDGAARPCRLAAEERACVANRLHRRRAQGGPAQRLFMKRCTVSRPPCTEGQARTEGEGRALQVHTSRSGPALQPKFPIATTAEASQVTSPAATLFSPLPNAPHPEPRSRPGGSRAWLP